MAALAVLSTALLAVWIVSAWARTRAVAQLAESSHHVLSLVAETLRGELAKHESTPFLISQNPRITRILTGSPPSDAEIQTANEDLERLARVTDASDLYLMNTTGTTIAASNWSDPRSFIGENFSYRPYFTEAMKGRLGRYFALGTTSGERGYYFAHPVFDGRYVVGVAVVKLRVGDLEAAWRAVDHTILVVDDDGVIFLSSEPGWVMRTMKPLDPEARARISQQRRYGAAEISPLGLDHRTVTEIGHAVIALAPPPASPSAKPASYLVQQRAMPDAGWTIQILSRMDGVATAVNTAAALTLATLAALLLAASNIYLRRRRLADRMALQRSITAELERRVAERTDELTQINVRLEGEVAERKRAEMELRHTQGELIQASKLAALGQMSAGLSHELNQPLAAIRSYAENARAFLDRERFETVRTNLGAIDELTQRMASIIRHLRTYARKEPTTVRPTSVNRAIDESLGLLQRRIADDDATITIETPDHEVLAIAGDVRLQQVLVNLIANALDAMRTTPRRDVAISVTETTDWVTIAVKDTGPGIAPGDLGNVFDPFFTTKDVGAGLGLGLSITYGIVQQFGGNISASNAPGGGAEFVVTLKAAAVPIESAA
ncbi:MAG: sensor histidine kinase [Hyphomicrobiaceae bacterium]|nr:sensor histidine kinase [Hyphomicrobiaceae bacterium]